MKDNRSKSRKAPKSKKNLEDGDNEDQWVLPVYQIGGNENEKKTPRKGILERENVFRKPFEKE